MHGDQRETHGECAIPGGEEIVGIRSHQAERQRVGIDREIKRAAAQRLGRTDHRIVIIGFPNDILGQRDGHGWLHLGCRRRRRIPGCQSGKSGHEPQHDRHDKEPLHPSAPKQKSLSWPGLTRPPSRAASAARVESSRRTEPAEDFTHTFAYCFGSKASRTDSPMNTTSTSVMVIAPNGARVSHSLSRLSDSSA